MKKEKTDETVKETGENKRKLHKMSEVKYKLINSTILIFMKNGLIKIIH